MVENSVVRFYRTTATDGKPYNVKHYSLPLIIALGYRVRSSQGTQFRRWATATVEAYLVKGFVMAADYVPSNKETTLFFQTIQNKLHFASTGLNAMAKKP